MAAKFHGQGLVDALEALLNVASAPSGTVELRYLKSYTPDPDDSYWSDISASEASGAPTVTVSGLSVSYDSANDRVEIDFTDPSDNSISTDTDGIALIVNTGTDSTSPIVFTTDITNLVPVSGTLSLTLDANGLCALNANAT